MYCCEQEWLEWKREKAKGGDPLRLRLENYISRFEMSGIPEMYNVEKQQII